MNSFLAELAGEATQKLEAKRNLQQDRQAMRQGVHDSLHRAVQFLTVFSKHLNAIEPEIPRVYALDGKARFSDLKWKNSLVNSRKQSLADDALLDHVFIQVRLASPAPVEATRRWEKFAEFKQQLQSFSLKPMADLDDLWRDRNQKPMLQVALEPEVLIWVRFQGNYEDGTIDIQSNNLDGFGMMKGKLPAASLQSASLEALGRFLMGRVHSLPDELRLERDLA